MHDQPRCLFDNEIHCVKMYIAPQEPVVPCLRCRKDFVWWLHPVQLCDGCVELEFVQAEI